MKLTLTGGNRLTFEQKFFSAELVDLRNCLDDNIALVKKIREDSY